MELHEREQDVYPVKDITKRYVPIDASCAAPRFFVGTGQARRRIISWELARGVRGNLTREEV
jgi:hypothetical protein